jgi:hypothetical protein
VRGRGITRCGRRLNAGADWIDSGLVFTTYARRGSGRKVGAGLQPRNVVRIRAAC